jgi:hypothetical protein
VWTIFEQYTWQRVTIHSDVKEKHTQIQYNNNNNNNNIYNVTLYLHCQTWPCWQQTTARVYYKRDKSWQKYIKIKWENLSHRYVPAGNRLKLVYRARCWLTRQCATHVINPQDIHMTVLFIYCLRSTFNFQFSKIRFCCTGMVFNVTFNNISVISGRSVLLVEKTVVSGENHSPAASHWQTLSHNHYDNVLFIYCLRSTFNFQFSKIRFCCTRKDRNRNIRNKVNPFSPLTRDSTDVYQ